MTEEVGELAEQDNHHYGGSDSKGDKLGAPDRQQLADELRDVLVGVLAIARFTSTEQQLLASIVRRHERLVAGGFIDDQSAR